MIAHTETSSREPREARRARLALRLADLSMRLGQAEDTPGPALPTLFDEVRGALEEAQAEFETADRPGAGPAEEDLRRRAAELEEHVHQRTMELEESNEQLSAFSYSVSHDLRAPLRAVRGFAEALIEEYGDRLDAVGKGYVGRMIAAARQMDTLILDLLAYSRLTRVELAREPVDLGTVVAEALATLEGDIAATGARIEVVPGFPAVIGHRPVLVQSVINLLTNALKFVPSRVAPRVRIRAEARPSAVRLWIEDNGIGIAPEYQERVFGVFERLLPADRYPGTGLGLAMVRKAMDRLEGSTGVASEPGKGSRFWIELPAAGN
jgi:signal transduction histidine kinase